MWVKKLSPKKVSNLAEVTQLESPVSVPPRSGNGYAISPGSFNKAQKAKAGASPTPYRAGLCSFLLHSGRQPPGTKMAQRHTWGKVRSHSQDDLAIPALHQMVNIPRLSV